MFQLQVHSSEQLEELGLLMEPPADLPDAMGLFEGDILPPMNSTRTAQLAQLLGREGRRLVRDKPALIGRFGVTIF